MSHPSGFAGTAPLRVLLVSQHFWPEQFRINDVALALQEQGCKLTVLTGQPNYPAGKVFDGYRAASWRADQFKGLGIYRVPLVPRGSGRAVSLALNYLSFVASTLVFAPWRLRGESFDVVFVYGTSPILQAIGALALARLKRAPCVVWVQDLWPQSLEVTGYVSNHRVLDGVAKVVAWIYRRSDLLLVPSKAFKASVELLSGGTPVRYHPNPGDRLQAGPENTSVAVALGAGFHVVFAGNLGKAQALETLIDAAALVQDLIDVRVVLVGSGQLDHWLAEQIRLRKLKNVVLAGRHPPEAMPGILAQAAAAVVSLRQSPAMAMTVPAKTQTYMAAACPIIASMDGEGARIVRESGGGLVCPAGDAQALAKAIRTLHAMSSFERQEMGARGRAYFDENYDPVRLALRLKAHLNWAVEARSTNQA